MMQIMQESLDKLCKEARSCKLCINKLPLGAKPIFQAHTQSKILIVGQAPGLLAHNLGRPFMDKSGERLRAWMGISQDRFYNSEDIAILPMGFCYPGKAKSGDLPPLVQCAEKWQAPFMSHLPNIKLKLFIGLHAQRWYLGKKCKTTLTQTVKQWREYSESDLQVIQIPLPHPSPRNNIWLAKNAWFEQDVLPELRMYVANLLA